MCFLSRQNICWDNSSTRLALVRREKEEGEGREKNHNKKKPTQKNPWALSAASPPDPPSPSRARQGPLACCAQFRAAAGTGRAWRLRPRRGEKGCHPSGAQASPIPAVSPPAAPLCQGRVPGCTAAPPRVSVPGCRCTAGIACRHHRGVPGPAVALATLSLRRGGKRERRKETLIRAREQTEIAGSPGPRCLTESSAEERGTSRRDAGADRWHIPKQRTRERGKLQKGFAKPRANRRAKIHRRFRIVVAGID